MNSLAGEWIWTKDFPKFQIVCNVQSLRRIKSLYFFFLYEILIVVNFLLPIFLWLVSKLGLIPWLLLLYSNAKLELNLDELRGE